MRPRRALHRRRQPDKSDSWITPDPVAVVDVPLGVTGTSGPLRIVHLLSPAMFGGLERVVEMLAVGQRQRGHEVQVVASVGPMNGDHPLLVTLERRRVPVVVIRTPSRAYMAERAELRRLFADWSPDIAHSHGYRSDVLTALAARKMPVATVSTAHGFTGGGWRNRTYELVQQVAWRRFGSVVAVSRPLERKLRGKVGAERVRLIPNAWSREAAPIAAAEARAILGLSTQYPLVGWVGRLSREKGADVMIEAFAQVSDSRWHLALIGDGAERVHLEARIAQLGLGDRVHLLGAVSEAGRLFPAFDCFALSSRTEGTPIALLEAMAAGVPIVATAVGGVPDVVGPAEAVLVESENPAALARAIDETGADPSASAQRVRAATLRLDTGFGMESWLNAYDSVYYPLVQSRPGRGP